MLATVPFSNLAVLWPECACVHTGVCRAVRCYITIFVFCKRAMERCHESLMCPLTKSASLQTLQLSLTQTIQQSLITVNGSINSILPR